jgi:uncharacterized protein (TIGR02266 family)
MSESHRPERRAHPRCALELWVEETAGEVTYYQRTANVSLGGMYLSGTIPHPPGTPVKVEFSVPGDPERFRVPGEVVADPTAGTLGMRIRFVDLEAPVRERLERALGRSGAGGG